jgi:hypothetical protein
LRQNLLFCWKTLFIADFILQFQKLPPQCRRIKRAQLIPVCQNSLNQIVLPARLALQINFARVYHQFCLIFPDRSANLATGPSLLIWLDRHCFAGEYHFGGEERTPLAGGGVVARRAADEFVAAIGVFHQSGGAENPDGLEAGTTDNVEGGKLKPDGFFDFHAASMTRRVGHWRSMGLENGTDGTDVCV